MNVKEIAKKLNIKLKKETLENEIAKNEKYLYYLGDLKQNEKEAIALCTLMGKDIEMITLRGRRTKYQIGCNLGNATLVRHFYE